MISPLSNADGRSSGNAKRPSGRKMDRTNPSTMPWTCSPTLRAGLHIGHPEVTLPRTSLPVIVKHVVSMFCTPWAGMPSDFLPSNTRSRQEPIHLKRLRRASIISVVRSKASVSPSTGTVRSTQRTHAITNGLNGFS